jgi:hypothetical protein
MKCYWFSWLVFIFTLVVIWSQYIRNIWWQNRIESFCWFRFGCLFRGDKFEFWLLEEFVSCISYIKFCPGINCQFSIEAYSDDDHDFNCVQCNCGHIFCFHCTLEDHRPANCEQTKLWIQKNTSDAVMWNIHRYSFLFIFCIYWFCFVWMFVLLLLFCFRSRW